MAITYGMPAAKSVSFAEQESEADHIGLDYLARAGYRPHNAVAFWQRMDRASKSDPPEWFSATVELSRPDAGGSARASRSGACEEKRSERQRVRPQRG
jgi:hypothetical protein